MTSSTRIFYKKTSNLTLILLSFIIFCTVIIFFLAAAFKSYNIAFIKKSTAQINWHSLFKITLFTFEQALLSLLISLAIGLPFAWLVTKKNFFLNKFILSFSAIPLCVPAIVVALSYIGTFGRAGTVNTFLISTLKLNISPFTFLYSIWGIVICQGFYNFPLVMLNIHTLWKKLDISQEQSAALLGASKSKIFFKITLPKLIPGILSASIPIFLFCYFSFMIVQLFGSMDGTTFESAIYSNAKITLDLKKAGILSIFESLFALITLYFYGLSENKADKDKSIKISDLQKENISSKEIPFIIILLSLIILFFFIPMIGIILNTFTAGQKGNSYFTLQNWKNLFLIKNFPKLIGTTLFTATISASITTLCGTFYSIFLISKSESKKLILYKTIPFIPMAVSSIVLGFGISMLFKKSSVIHLIIAQSSLYWPFTFRLIYAQMKKIPQNIIYSCDILSGNKIQKIFSIFIPYSKSSIINAWGLCFALSAGDAALPLMLSINNYNSLALLTYRLTGSYRIGQGCCAGILLGAICLAVFNLSSIPANYIFRKRGNIK